jgi:hypothetical protein
LREGDERGASILLFWSGLVRGLGCGCRAGWRGGSYDTGVKGRSEVGDVDGGRKWFEIRRRVLE